MYDFIHFLDYEQPWHTTKSYFQIYQSYTWVDWLLSEMILGGDVLTFEDLSQEQKIRLTVNIFPHGSTLLKMLAQQTGKDMQTERSAAEICDSIFRAAAVGTRKLSKSSFEPLPIRVPFVSDVYGLTPLDYALGNVNVEIDKYNRVFVKMSAEQK